MTIRCEATAKLRIAAITNTDRMIQSSLFTRSSRAVNDVMMTTLYGAHHPASERPWGSRGGGPSGAGPQIVSVVRSLADSP